MFVLFACWGFEDLCIWNVCCGFCFAGALGFKGFCRLGACFLNVFGRAWFSKEMLFAAWVLNACGLFGRLWCLLCFALSGPRVLRTLVVWNLFV